MKVKLYNHLLLNNVNLSDISKFFLNSYIDVALTYSHTWAHITFCDMGQYKNYTALNKCFSDYLYI